ncbi:hypothetical protein IIO_02049 [Bacillus cereus VD115]|nr:hypothetical protein IIO_02049 [Bacillus cereus VD115]
MACVHDFGIIDDFDYQRNYNNYTPEEYRCIAIDDDIISSLNQNLSIMKTYFHEVKKPEFGLSYWGITIIPPESLSIFYEAVTSSRFFKHSVELNELASKIVQATAEQKYMIHYGV